MAFNKRTWLGRQGTGLNKFSIGGATPVTIVNQPDSVTQVGDALSAGNLNDLEDRIEDAFDDVDTELATKADEQDVTNLNNAINQLDHRLENIEQSKGDYVVQNYKDGSITPSGKGKWCVVEGVEGVSRVENNLVPNATKTGSAEGLSYSRVNHTVTVTGTYQSGGDANAYIFSNDVMPEINGHNYLVYVTNPKFSLYIFGATTVGVQNAIVFPATASGQMQLTARATGFSNGATVNESFDVIVCDLSVYFGTSDLSFLGATNAEKLATIQKDYPHLLLPSDYGTRIVDWTGNGVRAEGVNIWDEEWEEGQYNPSTGQPISVSNAIRSKNFIPVSALTQYFIKLPSGVSPRIFFFDENEAFIGTVTDATFTTIVGTKYIKFHTSTGYGSTYAHDIQIADNSLPDAVKQTYHPYQSNTLSFPSTTLKSAGSVRDTLELNVEVDGVAKKRQTERIDSVDMGTLNWILDSGVFYARLDVMKEGYECLQSIYGNLGVQTWAYMTGTAGDKTFASAPSGSAYPYVMIKDSSFADAPSLKTYLTGKTMYYPLATESVTLSDPILDNTLLTEAYGRMSTVQTGTVVDGIADLGFITL